jgi:hypothetical protein
LASTSRNGGSCRCSRSSRKFRARICHVIGFDKGRSAGPGRNGGTRLVSIRADRQDGRTHSISLTAKGFTTHDQVIAVALARERRLLACLSKPERETLIALLLRVHGNLDAVKGAGEIDDRA